MNISSCTLQPTPFSLAVSDENSLMKASAAGLGELLFSHHHFLSRALPPEWRELIFKSRRHRATLRQLVFDIFLFESIVALCSVLVSSRKRATHETSTKRSLLEIATVFEKDVRLPNKFLTSHTHVHHEIYLLYIII